MIERPAGTVDQGFNQTIPIVEAEWVQFKARVLDRTIKAAGAPPLSTESIRLLHDTFYAGTLVMFGLAQKTTGDRWKALVDQIEAYYNEALRRAAEIRPVQ